MYRRRFVGNFFVEVEACFAIELAFGARFLEEAANVAHARDSFAYSWRSATIGSTRMARRAGM
jgi:hypothetical protein